VFARGFNGFLVVVGVAARPVAYEGEGKSDRQKNSRSWKGAAKATVISLMREITHFGQPDVLTKASDQRLMVNTVSVSRTDMQIVFIII